MVRATTVIVLGPAKPDSRLAFLRQNGRSSDTQENQDQDGVQTVS
jgi:hypothetical protein